MCSKKKKKIWCFFDDLKLLSALPVHSLCDSAHARTTLPFNLQVDLVSSADCVKFDRRLIYYFHYGRDKWWGRCDVETTSTKKNQTNKQNKTYIILILNGPNFGFGVKRKSLKKWCVSGKSPETFIILTYSNFNVHWSAWTSNKYKVTTLFICQHVQSILHVFLGIFVNQTQYVQWLTVYVNVNAQSCIGR